MRGARVHRPAASAHDRARSSNIVRQSAPAQNEAQQFAAGGGGAFDFPAVSVHAAPPFIQRKCACGGTKPSAAEEECTKCRAEKLARKSIAGESALPASIPVSAPDDPLEQEADRAAEQALAALAGGGSQNTAALAPHSSVVVSPSGPALQREEEAARSGGLIVDDETPSLTSGQMRKSAFLEQLRVEACAAADRELERAGRDTRGCPYVDKLLDHYGARDASYLERAIKKFAPGSAGASSASEVIPLLSARFAAGVATWVNTGQIPSDVPPELQSAMLAGDGMAAIGGVLSSIGSAIGGAISSIGQLFFKATSAGERAGVDRDAVSSRIGPGSALDSPTRSRMENAFGHNFDRVRIHADGEAAKVSRDLHAHAFTLGHHIAFAHGTYRPGTPAGDALLAHELAHVMQQGGSSPQPAPQTFARDEPAEHDADAAAEDVVRSLWAPRSEQRKTRKPLRRNGLRIQRCSEEKVAETKVADKAAQLPEKATEKATEKPAEVVPAHPACTTKVKPAKSFQEMIDLIKAAELRLAAAKISSPKDQIHAIRGVYYGTTWSRDFAKESSTTRNEGFQRFTRPSEADPAKSVPPDVSKILDCGVFEALQDSQDLVDPSGRHVDFGHLIIGLDARSDPAFAKEVTFPVSGLNIGLGGTGTELVTWLGDLGGGAAALAVRRVAKATTPVSNVFSGTDYGGSINLEGDVAGAVVASGSKSAVTAPSFGAGKKLSDVLTDYLSPSGAGTAWKERVKTFLTMNGATFDAAGALTNRDALIKAFAPKIETFACNYLASRVKDKATTGITEPEARAAAKSHVVTSSLEVATTFVDALDDALKSGGKLEAKRFPPVSPAGSSSCTMQIMGAGLLGK